MQVMHTRVCWCTYTHLPRYRRTDKVRAGCKGKHNHCQSVLARVAKHILPSGAAACAGWHQEPDSLCALGWALMGLKDLPVFEESPVPGECPDLEAPKDDEALGLGVEVWWCVSAEPSVRLSR